MPDENKEALITINRNIKEALKQKSAMAQRLDDVFNRCKETKGDEILVPQNVRERMKELCSDTEKILKDMPNKKFKLKAKINSSGALNSLKKANECIEKVSVNKSSFNKLMEFYGDKNEISEYKTKMNKYCADLSKIIENIKGAASKDKNNELFTDKNNNNSRIKLEEKINEKAEIHDEDQKLINLGHICIDNKDSNHGTYEEYIKDFFNKYINYEIDIDKSNEKKGTLVEAFKYVSIALRELKVVVAKNEKMVVKKGGINTTRYSIHSQMKEIRTNIEYFVRRGHDCISFLEGLPITSDKLQKKREEDIEKIKGYINSCDLFIDKINEEKASALYGETTFHNGNIPYLAIGEKYGGTFFYANDLRESCNMFTRSLNNIVSFIRGGRNVDFVSKSMGNLESQCKNLAESISDFLEEIKNFNGYFEIDSARDFYTVQAVGDNYKSILGEISKITKKVENTKKIDDKLNDMEKKMTDDIKEYNKTSSKIKRGIKRFFSIMGTIARYTLNVTEFLKNVLFISSTWTGLSQSLAKNDQTAAQVNVPIISN